MTITFLSSVDKFVIEVLVSLVETTVPELVTDRTKLALNALFLVFLSQTRFLEKVVLFILAPLRKLA